MNFKIGDFIRPNDEDDVYQINSISDMSLGKTYMGTSISSGHGRGFDVNATHYRKATDKDIEDVLDYAPLYFSFWIANKENEIVSNGQIFANSLENAKIIFNSMIADTDNLGDYYMSNTPMNFIK